MAFQNAFFRLADGKPTSAIHLGNLDHAAGARRPLHLAAIADSLPGSQSPSKAHAKTTLPPACCTVPSSRKLSLRSKARLLLEFPSRSFERKLAFHVLSLRDGPCAQIFLRPEWAARVHQKDFQLAIAPPIHQQTCASFCHEKLPDLQRTALCCKAIIGHTMFAFDCPCSPTILENIASRLNRKQTFDGLHGKCHLVLDEESPNVVAAGAIRVPVWLPLHWRNRRNPATPCAAPWSLPAASSKTEPS